MIEINYHLFYFLDQAVTQPMYANKRIKFGSSRTLVSRSDEFSALGIPRIKIFPFVDNERT